MNWRAAAWAWSAGTCLELIGCGGPTFVMQQYDGPPRPVDTLAIVRVNPGGPQLHAVDGESIRVAPEKGTRFHIEMLPGVHELGVDDPTTGFAGANVRFLAEPGKVYRMVVGVAPPEISPGAGLGAYAHEVDRASDSEIRPATSPPEAPPAEVSPQRAPP